MPAAQRANVKKAQDKMKAGNIVKKALSKAAEAQVNARKAAKAIVCRAKIHARAEAKAIIEAAKSEAAQKSKAMLLHARTSLCKDTAQSKREAATKAKLFAEKVRARASATAREVVMRARAVRREKAQAESLRARDKPKAASAKAREETRARAVEQSRSIRQRAQLRAKEIRARAADEASQIVKVAKAQAGSSSVNPAVPRAVKPIPLALNPVLARRSALTGIQKNRTSQIRQLAFATPSHRQCSAKVDAIAGSLDACPTFVADLD